MEVGDTAFSVTLSFGGRNERLTVPYDAITGFVDPSVEFGLEFKLGHDEAPGSGDEEEDAKDDAAGTDVAAAGARVAPAQWSSSIPSVKSSRATFALPEDTRTSRRGRSKTRSGPSRYRAGGIGGRKPNDRCKISVSVAIACQRP